MKQCDMKGAAGQCRGTSAPLTAGGEALSGAPALIWAEYVEPSPSQSNPIMSIASGLRVLYDDIIRQPLPARIGELAAFLTAKESWQ